MSETHSIWLMPAENDLGLLQSIVQRLADEFGTPCFCPHLTLVEDMPRASAELIVLLSECFSSEPPFQGVVSAVIGTTMFYRSLYAAFAPEEALLSLKGKAVEAFAKGDLASFVPHISLVYGITEFHRLQVSEALEQELLGRKVLFDSIAVVASAQSIPIADWSIVYRLRLGIDATSQSRAGANCPI